MRGTNSTSTLRHKIRKSVRWSLQLSSMEDRRGQSWYNFWDEAIMIASEVLNE